MNLDDLSDAKRRLIAKRLRSLSASQFATERIQPRPVGIRTPISADQYRIWLHGLTQPGLPIYNEPITIQRWGDLDIALLEESFNCFLQRHEIWRTSFDLHQEEVIQVIHPDLKVKLGFVDLSKFKESEQEVEAKRLATEQATLPINLAEVPLFRALVVRFTSKDYRIYMVVHHIIFDGLSIKRTFLPELAAIYSALQNGVKPQLSQQPLQYGDYAVWRKEQLSSISMKSQLKYWCNELAGELPVLRLPSDRPRPAVVNHRGGMERFVISSELMKSLKTLGHMHGTTLYMTLLAVFKVLLFRYSGQEDILVGGVTDGRRRHELQGMMGCILDTFTVRTHPCAKLRFSDFLGQVKHAVLGALDAAEVPFDQIVQTLAYKRDLSHHPIFQTFLSLQPTAGNFPAGWEITPMDVTVGASKFDVYLEIDERPDYTAARIMYRTDMFEAETISRMSGHLLTLFEAVSKNPDTLLGDLPLLTEQERELMLMTWNNRDRPMPATTIHALVEEQVRRYPDRVAVQFEHIVLTYAQLDQQAEMLVAHLREAGAGAGTLIALCIDRSQHLIVGLLAILKTGAAYLPLDPATPRSRILVCLEDAAPIIILTQRGRVSDLPAGCGKVLTLEDLLNGSEVVIETISPNISEHVSGPEDTAYVIHTSGSTGRPKAVELSHGSAVNLLLSMQREPGFTFADTLLAITTISFDIAVLELFLPLISGGRLVIASRSVAMDPTRLAAMIRTTGCTMLQATPATWRGLLAIDWPGYTGLRCLCGGEPLTADLAQGLLALSLEVWNVYGPTETTIWSTAHRVRNGSAPIPIGRPIANTTTYILDAGQQPVPVGVPGELYIGGLGVAKGYRGQPSLTAEKFITLPIAQGERLYRTGDYALYRADGTIECQGRADNQVKVRGYRIELEDVEMNVNAHPRVATAAARVWPDLSGGNRLSIYVVGKNGPSPSASELREFLQSRIPEYMIPSDVIALDVMPLTSNGKIDRKALSPPNCRASRAVSMLPTTEEEKKLAKIWSEALGITIIGRDDNFFDLGGHSLLLVRLFARINREFGATLPITTIFDTQTLSGLAKVLKDKVRISSLVPVQTAGLRLPLFMAHSYLLYHAMSSALGGNQPFYGLRELEEDGIESLEERAMRYVGDMRRVQRFGPYHIAGWCAAGPLAVEIARQLIIAGEEVALLVLFDSWLPGYAEGLELLDDTQSHRSVLRAKFARYRKRLHGLTMVGQMRYLLHTLRRMSKEARDRFYINHWGDVNRLSKKIRIPLPEFMHNTTLQTFAAMREFHPGPIPVALTLIRASESREIARATDSCGWEQIASRGVKVLWAPGDHETMFRGANLKVTAALVSEAMTGSQKLHSEEISPEMVVVSGS